MTQRVEGREATIINGELAHTSPSQVGTCDLCQRKWWYERVKKLPRKPPGKGQLLGDKCHNELKHFLLTGEDVRSDLTRSGDKLLVPYLPRAPFKGGDLSVEGFLDGHATPGGVKFQMFADILAPDPIEPEVVDHKFKKDLDRYGVTEDELRTDVQVITYAEWLRRRTPTATSVRVSHHQHQTQGRRRAERVSVSLPVLHVQQEFTKIAARIDGTMRALVKVATAEEVPANTDSCGAFGGCDFLAACPDSPVNKYALSLLPDERNEPMGLLALMTNKGGVVAAPAATPAPAAPAGSIPASEGEDGKKYRLADGRVAEVQARTPKGVFLLLDDNSPHKIAPTDLLLPYVATHATAAITPPDAPVSSPATAPPATDQRDTEEDEDDEEVAPVAAALTTIAQATTEQLVAATDGKPKRGRKAAAAPVAANGDFVLYVDCVPSTPFRDLTPYVSELAAKLAKAAGALDVRVANQDSPLGYGKWKGAMSAAALAEVPAGPCVISRGDLADPVIEALAGKAVVVVRAAR